MYAIFLRLLKATITIQYECYIFKIVKSYYHNKI